MLLATSPRVVVFQCNFSFDSNFYWSWRQEYKLQKNHLRRLVKRYFESGHDLRGLVKPIKIFPHMNRFDMHTNIDHQRTDAGLLLDFMSSSFILIIDQLYIWIILWLRYFFPPPPPFWCECEFVESRVTRTHSLSLTRDRVRHWKWNIHDLVWALDCNVLVLLSATYTDSIQR